MFPIRDHNPSGQRGYVTLALIAVNVIVFLLYFPGATNNQLGFVFYTYGMVPEFLSQGQGMLGLLTHMFLHGDWLHLAFNMLFLFIYGDNVEDQLGPVRYLGFYLAAGVAAAGLQFVMDPTSPIPMVGASGAIAGVMGAYLLLYPRAKIDVLFIFIIFFRIFPIPAWIVLGIWFGLQMFSGLSVPSDEGGVAYWAHIGGFVAGVALVIPLWLRLGGPAFWARTHGHPPHPEARYPASVTQIPRVPRR